MAPQNKIRFRFVRVAATDFPSQVQDNGSDLCLRVAFSSETPVLRVGDGFDHDEGAEFYEILDHEIANADLSLLQNRGAVLDEHDVKSPIGVILKAQIDPDKKGRADIEMDSDGLGLERCGQMRSLMRPHISFGYDLTKTLSTGTHTDGRPMKRFAWRAHEISSVAIPADGSVGVGRTHPATGNGAEPVNFIALLERLTPKEKNRMRTLLDAAPADGNGTITTAQSQAAVAEARKLAAGNERKRITGIREIATAFKRDFQHPESVKKIDELAAAAEAGEESPGEFSVRVLTTEAKTFQRANVKVIAEDELHDDISQYSFARALRSCVEQNRESAIPEGLEGEVHAEISKRNKGVFKPHGFLMPYNRKLRTAATNRRTRAAGYLQVGVFGQGGALVQTDVYMPLIQLLRNLMVTERLGMKTIAGIEGMIAWPRHVAACTPYFVPETFLLNVSNPLLDQLAASPHRVGVTGSYDKQLILQSVLDVENWLRDDQLKSHAVLVDQVSLLGTGANNQPVGIFNTPGIGAVNFGGAVTYQKVVNFKTQLALGNAAVANMAFVTTPLVEEKWRTTPKVGTTFPIFIWEDGSWGDETADGRVIGLRATATNQILNDRVGFGNFEDAKKLIWGGLDIVVNPYTRSKETIVEVTTNSWMDVMVDHQQSFAYSVDAGDQ